MAIFTGSCVLNRSKFPMQICDCVTQLVKLKCLYYFYFSPFHHHFSYSLYFTLRCQHCKPLCTVAITVFFMHMRHGSTIVAAAPSALPAHNQICVFSAFMQGMDNRHRAGLHNLLFLELGVQPREKYESQVLTCSL